MQLMTEAQTTDRVIYWSLGRMLHAFCLATDHWGLSWGISLPSRAQHSSVGSSPGYNCNGWLGIRPSYCLTTGSTKHHVWGLNPNHLIMHTTDGAEQLLYETATKCNNIISTAALAKDERCGKKSIIMQHRPDPDLCRVEHFVMPHCDLLGGSHLLHFFPLSVQEKKTIHCYVTESRETILHIYLPCYWYSISWLYITLDIIIS